MNFTVLCNMLERDMDDEIEKRVGTGPKYLELAIGSAEGSVLSASAAATTQRLC